MQCQQIEDTSDVRMLFGVTKSLRRAGDLMPSNRPSAKMHVLLWALQCVTESCMALLAASFGALHLRHMASSNVQHF